MNIDMGFANHIAPLGNHIYYEYAGPFVNATFDALRPQAPFEWREFKAMLYKMAERYLAGAQRVR